MVMYHPLSRENREFRLARFCQAHSDNPNDDYANIVLELKQFSMNDKPLYRALSYVWGDPSQKIDIEVNGEPFSIGSNLHAALMQLRQGQSCSWIWVDSICIEQTNIVEKSWHVNEMGSIFSDAEQVYMWLGQAADRSDEVMDFISRIGPYALQLWDLLGLSREMKTRIKDYVTNRLTVSTSIEALRPDTIDADSSYNVTGTQGRVALIGDALLGLAQYQNPYGRHEQSLISGMECLLRRDYWHRIWIIQEVALAKKAVVVCGQKTMALDLFDAAFSAIWYVLHEIPDGEHLKEQSFRTLQFINLYDSIKCIDIWRARQKSEGLVLGDILTEYTTMPGRPHYSATDPRDIVFGILGVISDLAEMDVHADYNKSTAEVFASVSRAMIYRFDGDPKTFPFRLGECNPTNSSLDLPSWVLDFRKMGQYGLLSTPISISGKFQASKNTSQTRLTRNHHVKDVYVLQRDGCSVDMVTEVMTPPQWHQLNGRDTFLADEEVWLKSVMDFTGITAAYPSPAEDYVWRTLLLEYEGGGSEYLQGDDNEISRIIRRVVRLQGIRGDELSNTQVDWMRQFLWCNDDDLDEVVYDFSHDYTRGPPP